jgi:hypothetical protein
VYRSHRSGWPEANSCLGQTLREQKDGNDAIVFWASLPMIERYEGSHRKSELLEDRLDSSGLERAKTYETDQE